MINRDHPEGVWFYIDLEKMAFQSMFCILLPLATVFSLIPHASAQCPTGCFNCQPIGVRTTRVVCTGAGLTAFPQLPVSIQQTVETL